MNFPKASFFFLVIRLVKNYLLHFGYEETFQAFNLATKSTVPPIYFAQEDGVEVQDTAYALNERKILRQVLNYLISTAFICYYWTDAYFGWLAKLIGKGEIDAALAKLRDCYPQLVQVDWKTSRKVLIKLLCILIWSFELLPQLYYIQDDKSEVCFLLRCQKFIELVRVCSLLLMILLAYQVDGG